MLEFPKLDRPQEPHRCCSHVTAAVAELGFAKGRPTTRIEAVGLGLIRRGRGTQEIRLEVAHQLQLLGNTFGLQPREMPYFQRISGADDLSREFWVFR